MEEDEEEEEESVCLRICVCVCVRARGSCMVLSTVPIPLVPLPLSLFYHLFFSHSHAEQSSVSWPRGYTPSTGTCVEPSYRKKNMQPTLLLGGICGRRTRGPRLCRFAHDLGFVTVFFPLGCCCCCVNFRWWRVWGRDGAEMGAAFQRQSIHIRTPSKISFFAPFDADVLETTTRKRTTQDDGGATYARARARLARLANKKEARSHAPPYPHGL